MKNRKRKQIINSFLFMTSVAIAIIAIIFVDFILPQKPVANLNNTYFIFVDLFAYCLLGFSLTELSIKYDHKHRSLHRVILITLFAISFIISFVKPQPVMPQHRLIYFFFVFSGSFLGSFFSSIHSSGIWENNEPPTKFVEKEVTEAHKDFRITSGNLHDIKRYFDVILASISILISFPAWFLITFLIWWEDPGPVLFVKNSVGLNGNNFKQFKFRSMITNAEKDTGPILGYEDDDRILFFGKFLRKTALDELPQLINILIGDMSYVGPRPQRTVLVHQYLQTMPEYAARHQVRPGLAGLAQVADSYHISPEEKLAWDLVYIENATLWFDLKIIFSAFLLVFVLRWVPNNDPASTIRSLLNVKKPGLD